MADVASDSSINNVEAVKRCLNNETPGSKPPPKQKIAEAKSDSTSSSSSSGANMTSNNNNSESKVSSSSSPPFDSKGPDESGSPSSNERGKSRGGTRGGKPNMATADIGLSGIGGVAPPPNLDAFIEKCDGSEAMTQSLLGEIITKPNLTSKLLSKPPFRFLHDIIMEVIKVTNFAHGLFTPEECDSSQVSEKSQKLQFLDKIIKLVGVQLNTLVEAKSAKIVAGLDAQNTNNFLQLLSIAARHMPDSSIAVNTVLSSMGLPINESLKQEQQQQQSSSRYQSATGSTSEPKDNQVYREKEEKKSISTAADEKPSSSSSSSTNNNNNNGSSSNNDEDDGDGENKRSARPTTARRRPPKVKDGAQEVSTGVQPITKKAEGILIDGQNDDDDDDIPDTTSRLADDMKQDMKKDNNSDTQSKIVKDILSRQAEQEAASRTSGAQSTVEDDSAAASKDDASKGGIRLGRLRKTGLEKKGSSSSISSGTGSGGRVVIDDNDIEKIRSAIQLLVQHTGPLGTCMDYIQEDIGLMTLELHKWEEESRKYEADVDIERRKSRELLHPLYVEQADVEDQINEQVGKISSMKASIAKNNDRIQQILKLIATA